MRPQTVGHNRVTKHSTAQEHLARILIHCDSHTDVTPDPAGWPHIGSSRKEPGLQAVERLGLDLSREKLCMSCHTVGCHSQSCVCLPNLVENPFAAFSLTDGVILDCLVSLSETQLPHL